MYLFSFRPLRLSKEGIKIVLSFSSEFDIPEAINWVESSLGKGTVDNRNVFVRWQLPNCDLGERMIDAIDEELTLGAQKARIGSTNHIRAFCLLSARLCAADVSGSCLHLLDPLQ